MPDQLNYEDFLNQLEIMPTGDCPSFFPGAPVDVAMDFVARGHSLYFAYLHEFHFGTANPWMATEDQASRGVSLMGRFPEKLETKIGCAADDIAYACCKVLRGHPDVMPFNRKVIAAKAIIALWVHWRKYLSCQDKHILERIFEAIESTHSEIEDVRLYEMFDDKMKAEIRLACGFEQSANAEAGAQWRR